MTLQDIKLEISPSRVVSRTLSRHHLFPGPLRSPSQEIPRKPEEFLELSGGALCLSQEVVLRLSGAEGASSQKVPRLPAEILDLSEIVAPCWSEARTAPS